MIMRKRHSGDSNIVYFTVGIISAKIPYNLYPTVDNVDISVVLSAFILAELLVPVATI